MSYSGQKKNDHISQLATAALLSFCFYTQAYGINAISSGVASQPGAAYIPGQASQKSQGYKPMKRSAADSKKPPLKLTLQEAIDLALREDPDVRSAEIQRVADKWSLKAAQYDFQWQYSVGGSFNYTKNSGSPGENDESLTPQASYTTPIGTKVTVSQENQATNGAYDPSLTLTLTQPLLKGFGQKYVEADLYNAEDSELVNQLTMKSSIMSAIDSIISSYTNYVNQQYSIQTSKLALDADKQTLRQTEALIKAGRKAPTEVYEAKSAVAQDEVSYTQAKNSADQDRISLLITIGLPPNLPISVPSDINIKKTKLMPLNDAIKLALANNPTYQQDLINLRADKRALYVAKQNERWELDLNTSSSIGTTTSGLETSSGFTSLTEGEDNNTIGLTLNIPIGDVTLKQAEVDAEVTLEQAQLNLIKDKDNLIAQTMNDRRNVQNDWIQYQNTKVALKLEERNQKIKQEKNKLGLVSTFEVTNDLKNLVSARSNLIQSKVTYITDLNTFYDELGTSLDKWNIKLAY